MPFILSEEATLWAKLVVLELQHGPDQVVSLPTDGQKTQAGIFWDNAIELEKTGLEAGGGGKIDVKSVLRRLPTQTVLSALGIYENEILD